MDSAAGRQYNPLRRVRGSRLHDMVEERLQRRLAAILVADVVGYSRLMEADEAGTRVRLRSLRSELSDVAAEVDKSEVTVAGLRADLVEAKAALEASQAVGRQPDWSVLLALLADSLGETVVLRRCKLTPMGGRDGAGEVIKLEVGGLAQSQQAVAQVILRLEQTPLFRSVKLIDTRREPFRDTHAVAFRAECILDSGREAGS